jgi:hypothetical protein
VKQVDLGSKDLKGKGQRIYKISASRERWMG